MKVKEFQHAIKKEGIDIALFFNLDSMEGNPNLFYFSGYTGVGALVIPKNSPSFLLAPRMEYERARKESGMNVASIEKKKLFDSVKQILQRKGIRFHTVGIDYGTTPISLFRTLKKNFKKKKTKDVSKICAQLRILKTKKELAILQKACSITNSIVNKCIASLKRFRTEADVAAFLANETRKQGCELSFPPIVASGKKASMPHYWPRNVKLNNGFCVIDFGIKYKGYCSDITRTVYLGNPTQKEKEIYEFLLKIQEDTIKKIKEGGRCSEIYEFVKKSLGKYGQYFTHGLGHGIGVQIHELPNLTDKSKDRFQDGMVFTVEPGVYIPGKWGIRIEDDILLSGKKKRLLTTVPKKLKNVN